VGVRLGVAGVAAVKVLGVSNMVDMCSHLQSTWNWVVKMLRGRWCMSRRARRTWSRGGGRDARPA